MAKDFKEALEDFNDSVIAQQLLGDWEGFFSQGDVRQVNQNLSTHEKLEKLLLELKEWVILKSNELEEFEGEELVRLKGEAVGCMYAIRELYTYFNELQNT